MAQNLSVGFSGPDVRLNQQALNRAGASILPKLVEDSVFGQKTKARVIEFQRSRGLTPDGVIGPKTRAPLGTSAGVPGAPPALGINTPVGGNVVSAVTSSIAPAVGSWKNAARFQGVMIFGPTANGPRGCLVGPSLAGFMQGNIAQLQGDDKAIAVAAVTGLSAAFERWRASVSVPGLPWYPAFAAFPGPQAPPMPDVPSPLVALSGGGLTEITSVGLLQNAMVQAADPGVRAKGMPAFLQIAAVASALFTGLIATSFVRNALGQGPIPSFAPPAIPVGPVVGGTVLPIPGVLS